MPSTPATAGVYSPRMPSTPATAGVYSTIACHQRPPLRASILLACHQRPPQGRLFSSHAINARHRGRQFPLAKSITSAVGRCLFPLAIYGEGVADRPGVRSKTQTKPPKNQKSPPQGRASMHHRLIILWACRIRLCGCRGLQHQS